MADVGGRPTVMTPDIIDELCYRLAGGESVRSICRSEHMPAASTVFLACVKDDAFRSSYTQAREAAGYAHGDEVKEVVELIRDGTIDALAGRAMMDGLKWSAERMAAKAYGSRKEIDHKSSDGSMTPKALDMSKLPTEALEAIVKAADGHSHD